MKANNTLGSPCFFVELPNGTFVYALTNSVVTSVDGANIGSEINGENVDDNSAATAPPVNGVPSVRIVKAAK